MKATRLGSRIGSTPPRTERGSTQGPGTITWFSVGRPTWV